jgi:hypothetical protein
MNSDTNSLIKNYIFYKNFSYKFIDNDIILFNKNNNNGKNIPALFSSSSSSIIKHPNYENRFILNIRCVNYRLLKNTKSTLDTSVSIGFTINHILILDKYFCPIGKFIDKPIISKNKYVGIEDIRIFNFNNKIYYIGSAYDDKTDSIKISSDEFQIRNKYNYNIITPSFKTEFKNEKNWVFFENNNEMFVVYKWSPIYICKIDYNTKSLNLINKIIAPESFNKFRGSTNGVLFDNKIWFIVHSQNEFKHVKYYTHNFVVLNTDLTIYGYTNSFNFGNKLVEFCIGMTTRNNNFIITYSTLDSSTKLGVLSCNFINSLLIKI